MSESWIVYKRTILDAIKRFPESKKAFEAIFPEEKKKVVTFAAHNVAFYNLKTLSGSSKESIFYDKKKQVFGDEFKGSDRSRRFTKITFEWEE